MQGKMSERIIPCHHSTPYELNKHNHSSTDRVTDHITMHVRLWRVKNL